MCAMHINTGMCPREILWTQGTYARKRSLAVERAPNTVINTQHKNRNVVPHLQLLEVGKDCSLFPRWAC